MTEQPARGRPVRTTAAQRAAQAAAAGGSPYAGLVSRTLAFCFDVLVINPSTGSIGTRQVLAHSHHVDKRSNLSFVTINIDGTHNIRHLFRARRWLDVVEVGTSLVHASKLVQH